MGARKIHGSFMTSLGGFQRCKKWTRGVSSNDGIGEVSGVVSNAHRAPGHESYAPP